MKRLMNILVLSCQKASELIEKQQYFGLTSTEKIRLLMHTSMCDACSSWQKQSSDIDQVLQQRAEEPTPPDTNTEVGLSEAKMAIFRKLKSNDGNKE